MPKGIPDKRYTPEFKKMVIETMREEMLYLLLQMKEYESAFKNYRQYSEAFNRLCEFAKEFMDNDEAIDRGDSRAWLMLICSRKYRLKSQKNMTNCFG